MSTAAQPVRIDLEITSDTICPFCTLGYRRIREAASKVQSDPSLPPTTFNFRFKPFQLDPTLPLSPGENKRERYERRFGGKEKVDAMISAMQERGKGVNPPIQFSYGGNVMNTKDSHRVLEKAWEKGGEELQLKVVEKLFTLYFEREADIGSFDVLSFAGVETGLFTSVEEGKAFLASDELKDEVEKGFREAQMKGISGVPFTIINQQFGVSGAQETETFVEVFKKLAKGELKAE
ncbi:hypothetical protein JCM8547_009350 [Rhodosporidiobolus lusitaniae]